MLPLQSCNSLERKITAQVFERENGESVLVHLTCRKSEYCRGYKSLDRGTNKRKSVKFSPAVKVMEYGSVEYAPPPNLMDILVDGGVQALHKHTELPFTFEHVPVSSIDCKDVTRTGCRLHEREWVEY